KTQITPRAVGGSGDWARMGRNFSGDEAYGPFRTGKFLCGEVFGEFTLEKQFAEGFRRFAGPQIFWWRAVGGQSARALSARGLICRGHLVRRRMPPTLRLGTPSAEEFRPHRARTCRGTSIATLAGAK